MKIFTIIKKMFHMKRFSISGRQLYVFFARRIIALHEATIQKSEKSTLFNMLKSFFVLTTIWLTLWHIICFYVGNQNLVPAPSVVLLRILELLKTFTVWQKIFNSTAKVLLSFCTAILLSLLTAAITNIFKHLKFFLAPVIHAIKAIPIACFIVLAILWLPSYFVSAFVSFLIAFSVIYNNMCQGILSADKKMLEMSAVFGLSQFKRAKMIYLPAIKPYFFSSCSSAFGLAWKSGISAEVIGSSKNSIGMEIYISQIHLDATALFAWSIIIIFLSFLLEKIMLNCILKYFKYS